LLAITFVIGGCRAKKPTSSEKLQIVTTVGMITNVVHCIAGDQADVIGLMGPGVDPHLYKASHGDVERLTQADIVFYNGLHLEGKMGDVLVKMAREKPVVAVTETIPENLLREPPEFQGHYDPHVWMDPSLWRYTLTPIVRDLSKLRPQSASQFQARAESLGIEMDSLYQWSRRELAAIPVEQRVLITAHDAFGYFGRAFDIEVRGLQGISTASEYGLNDVTGLAKLLASRKIKAVFVESSVPTKPLEAVLEGARAKGHEVKIGGTLYSDAMGDPNTPDGTYLGMIRHNVKTIAEALK
jgi:manganese/zinc/iron transport system substrate-binding protein